MLYSLGSTLLFIMIIGGLHICLKKLVSWRLNNNYVILLFLSPVPYGILAFILGNSTTTASFSTALNLVTISIIIYGLFIYSLKHRTYWIICYIPFSITTFCYSVSIIFYLTYVRGNSNDDPFMLPSPLDTFIDLLMTLNILLLLLMPITLLLSFSYHLFFKKRAIQLHGDVVHVALLLLGLVTLNWMSMLLFAGIVGIAD